MNDEPQAQADRIAAALVTKHLSGLPDSLYVGVVAVVAVGYMQGQVDGRGDVLVEWDKHLTARERAL